MPTGIRKTRKTYTKRATKAVAAVAPATDITFFSGFYVRKEGDRWYAKSNDQTVLSVDTDRDALVARVQATAKLLTEQGGNTEVSVYNEYGLVETRYSYWSQWSLENYNKPVEQAQPEQIRPY